jgi:hypothetical protein
MLGGSFIKHMKQNEAIRLTQKYIHSMIATLECSAAFRELPIV